MSLLLIGDSNVKRIWMHVRENREHLRSAVFVPVKRMDQLSTGFQAITASVSRFWLRYLDYDVNKQWLITVNLHFVCVILINLYFVSVVGRRFLVAYVQV